jgi:hypothetical protein
MPAENFIPLLYQPSGFLGSHYVPMLSTIPRAERVYPVGWLTANFVWYAVVLSVVGIFPPTQDVLTEAIHLLEAASVAGQSAAETAMSLAGVIMGEAAGFLRYGLHRGTPNTMLVKLVLVAPFVVMFRIPIVH